MGNLGFQPPQPPLPETSVTDGCIAGYCNTVEDCLFCIYSGRKQFQCRCPVLSLRMDWKANLVYMEGEIMVGVKIIIILRDY